MKKIFFTVLCALIVGGVWAQTPQNYHQFTDTKTVPTTSVKDQSRSGTCWSFSGLAFFESELLRTGKGEHDLSAMWIARHTYYEKVLKYVRLHGTINLSAGGAWEDVPDVIRKYGIVPTSVYSGLNYGLENHDHSELDQVIKAYADAVVEAKGKILTTAWINGLNGILDSYFGKVPEKFTYNGKEYTPQSFTQMLGLNMDDYVCLTSFTHHPFYTWFAIEIPDNWAWGRSFNVPQDEMLKVTEEGLNKGYGVWWGSDVSEPGFVYMRGIAFNVPDAIETAEGTELAKWVSVGASQKAAMLNKLLEGAINEREYTQEERQKAFDNYETTDDHGMFINGLATDQDGHKYFKVKNSWAETGPYKGYFYVSYPFFKYKTIDVAMHKDALPKDLKAKLGVK